MSTCITDIRSRSRDSIPFFPVPVSPKVKEWCISYLGVRIFTFYPHVLFLGKVTKMSVNEVLELRPPIKSRIYLHWHQQFKSKEEQYICWIICLAQFLRAKIFPFTVDFKAPIFVGNVRNRISREQTGKRVTCLKFGNRGNRILGKVKSLINRVQFSQLPRECSPKKCSKIKRSCFLATQKNVP